MDIFVNNVQFAIKLNTLLFPLDVQGFAQKLDSVGFNPVQKGQTTPDGLPAKPGDIAIKNNTFFNINNQSQTLTISSTRIEEINLIFNDVKNPLKLSGVDIDNDVRAYSITGEFLVETENNAFEKLRRFTNVSESSKSIDSIFGTDSQMMSLVLIPKDKSLLGDDFYQIRIEPFIQRLGKVYFVQYSKRSNDVEELMNILEELTSTVEKAILKIES